MSESATVLNAVLPVFTIIGLGLWIRRLNWLSEEADQSLLRVNINLLFPCLIFDKVLGNPALSNLSNLALAPAVGFGTVLLGFALAHVMRFLHGLKAGPEARTFNVVVGLYNYGYIPLPLSLMLFSGSETAGVLFVHNVGVELAMWTLGVMIFTGARGGADWKRFLNAPLISIVAALALNAVGARDYIPTPVAVAVHWLAECAIPVALILVGAVISDHLVDFHSRWGWRVMASAVLLRIVLLPVAFLILAKYLPATVELKRVIVLEAAMPSAVFPIIMSRHYHGDPPTALRVVIATSAVGLLSIPLWIRFGMRFVGI
jgi:predicted permease